MMPLAGRVIGRCRGDTDWCLRPSQDPYSSGTRVGPIELAVSEPLDHFAGDLSTKMRLPSGRRRRIPVEMSPGGIQVSLHRGKEPLMDLVWSRIDPSGESHRKGENDIVEVPEEIQEIGGQLEDFGTDQRVQGAPGHLPLAEIPHAQGSRLMNTVSVQSLADLMPIMLDKGVQILCFCQVLVVDVFVSEEIPSVLRHALCAS